MKLPVLVLCLLGHAVYAMDGLTVSGTTERMDRNEGLTTDVKIRVANGESFSGKAYYEVQFHGSVTKVSHGADKIVEMVANANKGNYILDSVDCPWLSVPKGLISWMEMEKFSAERYFKLGAGLGLLLQALESMTAGRQTFQGLTPNYISSALKGIEEDCLAISLNISARGAKRILAELTQGIPGVELKVKLDELRSVIGDEMESVLFLHIRNEFAEFYRKPYGFDDEKVKSSEAFPSIIADVEAAGNCLVVEQGTACVFHLMRIMEKGLMALAAPLGIPYAPSWESFLKQIDAKMSRKWDDKEPDWKKDEAFFKEAAAHLSAVRFAWRNPTMHIGPHHSAEEAKEIYAAVRTFMRHLATKVKE